MRNRTILTLTALLATLCLLLCPITAQRAKAEAPEGYPAVRIDPQTGRPYDFGGQTVYILDFWTQGNWADDDPQTDKDRALHAYRHWLQDTYNCVLVNTAGYSWGDAVDAVAGYCANPDGKLRLCVLPANFLIDAMRTNACANWRDGSQFDPSDAKWNQASIMLTSVRNGVYGVSVGASEPRQGVFFNKRVLQEAGIDSDELYDMQADGTWTWAAFEDCLSRVHRDTDGDGTIDVFGMTGSNVDMYRVAVFSNGGSFFNFDADGAIRVSSDSPASLQALNWAKRLWQSYAYAPGPDDSWDYYNQVWARGVCGFFIGQGYSGFSGADSIISASGDSWGFLAFPVGPGGDRYVHIASDNITVIPNAYDAHTVDMLAAIYDLWTMDTPGYPGDQAWIGDMLDYADERAVLETYAMLREPEHSVTDLATLLGSIDEVEASDFIWSLDEADAETLIWYKQRHWNNLCNGFNGTEPPVIDFDDYNTMILPSDLRVVMAEAFENTDPQVVVVPAGCVEIQPGAFAGCEHLLYVVIPRDSEIMIPREAFGDSAPELIWQ